MNTWILIIFIAAGLSDGGTSIQAIEMTSEASCRKAVVTLLDMNDIRKNGHPPYFVKATCVQK